MDEPICTVEHNDFQLDGSFDEIKVGTDNLWLKGKDGKYIETGITQNDMLKYDITVFDGTLALSNVDDYILEKLRRAGLMRSECDRYGR